MKIVNKTEAKKYFLKELVGGDVFLFADVPYMKLAKGLADKTLQSYEQQFRAVARHLDVKTDIAMLQNSFCRK